MSTTRVVGLLAPTPGRIVYEAFREHARAQGREMDDRHFESLDVVDRANWECGAAAVLESKIGRIETAAVEALTLIRRACGACACGSRQWTPANLDGMEWCRACGAVREDES